MRTYLPLTANSLKYQIVAGMVGITTRVSGGGASIQQVKTARKTAGGIAAKLLFYYHLPAKIHPERNGSEPDGALEQARAAGLHNA